jgi:hypothetical protein
VPPHFPENAGWPTQRLTPTSRVRAIFGPLWRVAKPASRVVNPAWPKPLRPMERTGIEPVTSGLQSRRSPS